MSTTLADPKFEELLEFLRDTRGFDYTAYKRPTLARRFLKRMQAAGLKTYEEYRHYLEAEPREVVELFDTILINVTSFFRDSHAWSYLAEHVLPTIGERKQARDPIRVWSAGCASGEEAYTAAILLNEALGEQSFRQRVKIYATDVDEDELTKARHAVYQAKDLEPVPEYLRTRYFQELNGDFVVRGDVRRSVIFGRNDLLSDPPISRVDLLISRNTLMYFSPQAQQRILNNYFFALNREGFLFLGKAEAFQRRTNLFEPVQLRHRVFVRNPTGAPQDGAVPADAAPPPWAAEDDNRIREVAFDHGPHAQIVIDDQGTVAVINHQARALFGLSQEDVGRPLRDLEVSYRPLELRALIDQATTDRRSIARRDVAWTSASVEDGCFDVQVAPLVSPGGELVGCSVSFADVSRSQALRDELARAKRELEAAYEALQSTVEELETTNEELQSTVEELETTNEELQSTNEELETTNEELRSTNDELHSTNEELETMNDEMRDRTDEALRASAFLGSILSSIHQSVVVLDPDLRVTSWSDAAADLWGLRADKVEGQFFLNLDLGLPIGQLRRPILDTLAGNEPENLEVAGHDRRGREIVCTVSFAPLSAHDGAHGVILVMSAKRGVETDP